MESEVSHLGPLTCFVKGLCNRVAADWSIVISAKNQSCARDVFDLRALTVLFYLLKDRSHGFRKRSYLPHLVFFLPPPGTITPSSQSISSQVSRRRSLRLKHVSMATISNFRSHGEQAGNNVFFSLTFKGRSRVCPLGNTPSKDTSDTWYTMPCFFAISSLCSRARFSTLFPGGVLVNRNSYDHSGKKPSDVCPERHA